MIARSRLLVVLGCITVHLVSLVCFLCGFFPTSSHLAPTLNPPKIDNLSFAECNRFKNSIENKKLRIVLLVIDALRADFLLDANGSRMGFLREKIDDGKWARAYTATVQSPTVTMPRIKVRLGSCHHHWVVVTDHRHMSNTTDCRSNAIDCLYDITD